MAAVNAEGIGSAEWRKTKLLVLMGWDRCAQAALVSEVSLDSKAGRLAVDDPERCDTPVCCAR
jgi:hypothetical protein